MTSTTTPRAAALRRHWAWQLLMLAIFGLVAYRVGETLASSWPELPPLRTRRSIWLLPSLLFGCLALASAGVGFRHVVRVVGGSIGLPESFWVTCASNMGKYLPGKIWAAAGKAVLSRRAGLPTSVALLATALDIYLLLLASFAVGGTLWTLHLGEPLLLAAVLAVTPALAALVHPSVFRLLSRLALRGAADHVPLLFSYGLGDVLRAGVWYVLFWILLAAGFLCVVEATVVPVGAWPALAGAFILSYLAGILAIFAPGGIGVREGVLHLMLGPVIGPGAAALLAVAGRIWATVAEIVALVVAFLLPRLQG